MKSSHISSDNYLYRLIKTCMQIFMLYILTLIFCSSPAFAHIVENGLGSSIYLYAKQITIRIINQSIYILSSLLLYFLIKNYGDKKYVVISILILLIILIYIFYPENNDNINIQGEGYKTINGVIVFEKQI